MPSAETTLIHFRKFFNKELSLVKKELRRMVQDAPPPVRKLVTLSLKSGQGKFLRSITLFLSAMVGAPETFRRITTSRTAIRCAALIEFLHEASLIHDDIVDGAMTRRGAPSFYRQNGIDAAILTGDYLFARVFSSAASSPDFISARILGKAVLAMAEAELLEFSSRGNTKLKLQDYIDIVAGKTGALFEAAARCGIHASRIEKNSAVSNSFSDTGQNFDISIQGCITVDSGCSFDESNFEKQLYLFARETGILYQLADDCNDMNPEFQSRGKPSLLDARSGTVTLPALLALKALPPEKKKQLEKILNGSSRYNSKKFLNLIKEGNGISAALDFRRRRFEKATGLLKNLKNVFCGAETSVSETISSFFQEHPVGTETTRDTALGLLICFARHLAHLHD